MFNLFFTILLQIYNFTPKTTPTWTVMFYLAGDNNLQKDVQNYCQSVIDNMNSIGKPYPVNIAIETDTYDDSIPTRRYFFFGDSSIEESIDSEVNMANEQELINFTQAAIVKMGTTSKYAVILYGHGCNWRGIIQDQHPFDWMGIPNGRFTTSITGIKQVIGQNINILGLLACQMQQWEVQQELSGLVNLTVGCWTTAGAPDNLHYLSRLLKNPMWCEESLAVSLAKTQSFSAIRTSEISKLIQDINNLALILKSASDSTRQRIIDDEITINDKGCIIERVSLGSFAIKLSDDSLLSVSIRTTASNIVNDIDTMTVYDPSLSKLQEVIGIYFPQTAKNYDTAYSRLSSSINTDWNEYLESNNFPYYWCYGWQKDYIHPYWQATATDTVREKHYCFSNGGIKGVRFHFNYLDLADGDTIVISDNKGKTFRYTGKRGEFFTPRMDTIVSVEFRGQSPIPANCFCLDNFSWTPDGELIGIAETEKIQKTTLSVWPNPFQKELHITNMGSESEAIIYDISGRIVKKLSLRESVWDGKDESGKTIHSGIYFLKIGKKSLKFVKIVN
ncbi:MAG: clostripain-related cysteine peptidase [Candidatus Omnitrophica bacterium]|nr:clostripain-related cysteine peptidase [Candidatus Omnitrophota bacterium]